MKKVTVDVTVDVPLDDIETSDLQKELSSRGFGTFDNAAELEKIWLHYRGKDVPKCLSDYIWNTIGKVL